MADISIINKDNTNYNVKDAVGRKALAVVENKGAKNDFDIENLIKSAISENVTYSLSGYSLTASSNGRYARVSIPYKFKAGTTVFSSVVSEYSKSGGTIYIRFATQSSSVGQITSEIEITGNGQYQREITVNADTDGFVIYYMNGSPDTYVNSAVFTNNMICTAAEWDISQAYVPYGKTNAELTSDISALSTENTRQETEIGVVANAGAKNLLWNHEAGYSETLHGRKFTVLSDGGIKIEGTASDSTNADFYIIGSWSNRNVLLNESNEQLSMRLSCTSDYGYNEIRFRVLDRSTGSTVSESGIEVNKDRTFSHIVTTVFITVWPTVTLPTNGIIVYPMIRPAAITDNTFVPYALSNPVITPALIAQVDGGAKNRLNYHLATFGDKSKITINQDGSITGSITSDTRQYTWANREFEFKLPAGDYAFLINRLAGDGAYTSARLMTAENANICSVSANPNIAPSMRSFTLNTEATIGFIGKVFTDTIQLMLCTAADWAVSQKFVPYSLPNPTLTPAVIKAVDEGAKNLVNAPNGSGVRFINIPIVLQPGDYYVLFQNISSTDTDAATCQFGAFHEDDSQASNFPQLKRGDNTGAMFSVSKQTSYVRVYASSSFAGGGGDTVTFTGCMICTKAEWDISQAYVPYAKTNVDLTNENANQQLEIDYAINTGVKNILNSVCHDIGEPVSSQGRTLTMLPDGGIKIEGTHTGSANYADFYLMGAWSETKYVMNLSNVPHIASIQAPDLTSNSDKAMIYLHIYDRHTGSTVQSVSPTSNISGSTFNFDPTAIYISVYKNLSIPTGGIVVYPMIRRAEITDATFQQYALSNPTLTQAAIKAVDEGSKNKCKITATTQTVRNVTFTVDAESGTITANGTANATDSIIISDIITTTEEMFLTGTPSGASGYNVRFGSSATYRDTGSGVSIPSGLSNPIYLAFNSGTVFSNVVIKPMICTASDLAVSKKFVPYAPTNRELYEEKIGIEDVFGVRPQIADNTDLNTLQTIGKYVCGGLAKAQTLLNCPMQGAFIMLVDAVGALTRLIQRIYGFDTNTGKVLIYIRALTINGWGSWYKFEGTEVT